MSGARLGCAFARKLQLSAGVAFLAACCGCASVTGLAWPGEVAPLFPGARLFAAGPGRDIGEIDTAVETERLRVRLGLATYTNVNINPQFLRAYVEANKGKHALVAGIGGFMREGWTTQYGGSEYVEVNWRHLCISYRYYLRKSEKWAWYLETGPEVLAFSLATELETQDVPNEGYFAVRGGGRLWLTRTGLAPFFDFYVGFLAGGGRKVEEKHATWSTYHYLEQFYLQFGVTVGITF